MTVSKLIEELEAAKNNYGDLEIIIVDGVDFVVYKGDFIVNPCENSINIEIGGLAFED